MRIAIFEEEHFEVLDFYIRIFQQAFGVQNVFLVTNERTYSLINNKTVLPQTALINNECTDKRIDVIIQFLNNSKIDVFLFNTIVYNQYKFANSLLQRVKKETAAKSVLTLHNINTVLVPRIFNCKNPYYLLLNAITSIRKKRILKNTDALNVICENQLKYILEKNLVHKPILNIPPCYYDSSKESDKNNHTNEVITLAIVGKIEENRKDYETVYNALNLLGKNLKNIQLFIIGYAIGAFAEKILNKFQQLQEKNGLFFWHPNENNGHIGVEEMMQIMERVDLFLCPTNLQTTYEGQTEYYGSSKSSGNFYDVVRFRKPAIFPSNIPLPKKLKDCMLSYTDEMELSLILEKLYKDKTRLSGLHQNVRNLSKTFSEEVIVQDVKVQFEQLLN